MANVINLDKEREKIERILKKGLASSNVSFLLGAGCSSMAIPHDKVNEEMINEASKNQDVEKETRLIYEFLSNIVSVCRQLTEEIQDQTVENTRETYMDFLKLLYEWLIKRHTPLHFRIINIFTTNYDLFIEAAASQYSQITLNDGFKRDTNLQKKYYFSSQEFCNYKTHAEYLYDYKTDLPIFNLIKLHGSLSWKQVDQSKITFNTEFPQIYNTKDPKELKKYNETFSLILPNIEKYHNTVLHDTYYDMIRLFSYELGRHNSLFISIGFSFKDSHLVQVLKRELMNPSLIFIAFAYNFQDVEYYNMLFKEYSNFFIVCSRDPEDKNKEGQDCLSFQQIVSTYLPRWN